MLNPLLMPSSVISTSARTTPATSNVVPRIDHGRPPSCPVKICAMQSSCSSVTAGGTTKTALPPPSWIAFGQSMSATALTSVEIDVAAVAFDDVRADGGLAAAVRGRREAGEVAGAARLAVAELVALALQTPCGGRVGVVIGSSLRERGQGLWSNDKRNAEGGEVADGGDGRDPLAPAARSSRGRSGRPGRSSRRGSSCRPRRGRPSVPSSTRGRRRRAWRPSAARRRASLCGLSEAHEERHRRAAVPQADRLERSQLPDRRGDQRAAREDRRPTSVRLRSVPSARARRSRPGRRSRSTRRCSPRRRTAAAPSVRQPRPRA